MSIKQVHLKSLHDRDNIHSTAGFEIKSASVHVEVAFDIMRSLEDFRLGRVFVLRPVGAVGLAVVEDEEDLMKPDSRDPGSFAEKIMQISC